MTRQRFFVTRRSRCDEEYHFYPKLLLEQTLVFIYLISQRYFVQIMPSVSNLFAVYYLRAVGPLDTFPVTKGEVAFNVPEAGKQSIAFYQILGELETLGLALIALHGPFDLFIRELDNLIDQLYLRERGFYRLGQSWGGFLAAQYAMRRPRWVKKLVIASGPADIALYVEGPQGLAEFRLSSSAPSRDTRVGGRRTRSRSRRCSSTWQE